MDSDHLAFVAELEATYDKRLALETKKLQHLQAEKDDMQFKLEESMARLTNAHKGARSSVAVPAAATSSQLSGRAAQVSWPRRLRHGAMQQRARRAHGRRRSGPSKRRSRSSRRCSSRRRRTSRTTQTACSTTWRPPKQRRAHSWTTPGRRSTFCRGACRAGLQLSTHTPVPAQNLLP